MALEGLDDDWVVWSEEPEQFVLVYRPDVFDAGDFPAPCLPTIFVTRGRRDRRPGRGRVGADWSVRLTLEPDVEVASTTHAGRAEALAGAVDLAGDFAAGAVPYREAYQVPREDYLDELDELTG